MIALKKIKYITIGFLVGVSLVVTVSVGENSKLNVEKLRELTQVFSSIKHFYVDEVDDNVLIDGAIEGMLSKLDPHSVFLPPQKHDDLKVLIHGEFGGLGIEVTLSEEGYVRVISPIDDTPAFREGIQSGDLIVRIDGAPVKGKTLREAVNIMRGKVGEKILLSIAREGESDWIEKEIIRDTIKVQSVKSRRIENDYGYLRVSRFHKTTGAQLEKNIDSLFAEQPALKGIVLDLRNNPGGVLSAAVDVSSTFMDGGGKVVYTKGRVRNSQKEYHARPGDRINGLPLVVLINEGSASASEIVAGALQDTKRAIIVGRQSFGKGSVQQSIPLKNSDSAIKLTIAKYYTPNDRTIQAVGISPDIVVPRMKIDVIDTPSRGRKEKDLPGHLDNNNENQKDTDSQKQDNILLVKSDYELYMALNVLKGISQSQNQ